MRYAEPTRATPSAAPTPPPPPVASREVPRTPPEELSALLRSLFSAEPALEGVDRRLLDMIAPSEDLAAWMQFFPGSGLFEAPVGAWINRRLDLPADGRRWPVAYRADKYTEVGAEGSVDFASWQVVHGVEGRARREEQVHLFSAVTLPGGMKKLAVSRRRRSISDAAELPDKTRDRYPLTTSRILDYREDPMFMRLARKSEKLCEVLGGSPAPGAIELVRTSMDRPFQQPVLKQVGARSHNYYVLNRASGARMFIHFFQFWQPEAPRIVDRLGRLLMPHELGRYEVTDFRAIPRTATWDPTLDTGLRPGRLPAGPARSAAFGPPPQAP